MSLKIYDLSHTFHQHMPEWPSSPGVNVMVNKFHAKDGLHQVQWEGETLSIIAKWYTGNSKNWKKLAKANPWVEPNNMFAGLKVKIPRQLLRNKKKMPREFVLSSASKNKDTSKTIEVSEKEAGGSSTGAGTAKGAYMQYVGP